MMHLLPKLLALVTIVSAVKNDLWMPSFFASNMVLQRAPVQPVVHGKAAAGALVTLRITRQDTGDVWTGQVKSDVTSGVWEAALPAQLKGGPAQLLVQSAVTGASQLFTNVMFGDVIFCSGQSNMEFGVNGVFNYTSERQDSINYPNLRLFEINRNPQNASVDDAPVKRGFGWVSPSPAVLGPDQGTHFPSSFSAVCYFAGRDLIRRDPSVPIGLMASVFGGTSDLRWSSPKALRACGVGPNARYSDLLERNGDYILESSICSDALVSRRSRRGAS
eukprot:TRINITY_DN39260_c0_g1_i1.p1 TRINITY_DN39260_c0_g1~~TRINITY_DN39260_c0_g1_i1.p1  ORF type:complete len:276 (+),score=61.75 TRINITY_DN39260_c0_g1_i1:3-830(+)